MLKTKVMGSGLLHLTDARYFASRGATWLGFEVGTPSTFKENALKVAAIKEWVDGVSIIGQFDVQTVENIVEWIQISGVEGIQLPSHRSLDLLPFLPSEMLVIIDFSQNEDPVLMKNLSTFSNAFLLNPSPQHYDYSIIYNWNENSEPLLNFIEKYSPEGIALRGGLEEKVGVKSFDDLDEIMDVLSF